MMMDILNIVGQWLLNSSLGALVMMVLAFVVFVGCAELYVRFKVPLKAFGKRFRKSRSGIIWVWTVGTITLFVFSIIWATIGMVCNMYLDTVENLYTFTGSSWNAIRTIRWSIGTLGVIVFFGVLAWCLLSSVKRQGVTYPESY
jgi:hypothetical protein